MSSKKSLHSTQAKQTQIENLLPQFFSDFENYFKIIQLQPFKLGEHWQVGVY